MRIVITKKESFTGKKNNTEYVKLSFVATDGSAGEIFTTREKYDGFKVDETKFLSAETVKNLLSGKNVLNAEFDQKGYLVEVH